MIPISEEAIRADLADPSVDMYIFDEIDSTNNFLKARITETPLARPAFAVTGKQTAGRGRSGHAFFSPAGGLYMSLAISPHNESLTIQKFTIASAVSAAEAIRETAGIECAVKWVNDIFYLGKKCAGILCEAPRRTDGSLAGVISGIGINVYEPSFPDELKEIAISLGRPDLDRNRLAASYANRLLFWSGRLADPALMEAYRNISFLLGRRVTFSRNGQTYAGKAIAIREDGNLVISLDDGAEISLNSGEVSLSAWA